MSTLPRLWEITLLALLGSAGVDGAELERALVSPDRAALAAIGADAAAVGLEPHLVAGPRRVRLAAVRAAPAAPDAWALLGPLAAVARDPDRSLAREAAASAATIAAAVDREAAATFDMPDDELGAALDDWRAIGADAARPVDVRVRALEIGRAVAAALDDAVAYDTGARLADPDPEIRRAALELLPQRAPPLALIAERLTDDDDPVVAVVAAQALCSGLAFGDPAPPRLTAAGDRGLARIRELVVGADLPPAARLDAARCLAADASDASRRALRKLATTAPRSIRRAVRDLARTVR
jgi:hypothetical protein